MGRKHFPEVQLLKPGSGPDQGGQKWVCIHVYKNINNMYLWRPLGDILSSFATVAPFGTRGVTPYMYIEI